MDSVEEGKASGKIIAMKVNMEGAAALRGNPVITGKKTNTLFVYVAPASLEEARKKLEEQYGLQTNELEAAMESLRAELEEARKDVDDGGIFDVVLENESTDVAYADLKMILAKHHPQVGAEEGRGRGAKPKRERGANRDRWGGRTEEEEGEGAGGALITPTANALTEESVVLLTCSDCGSPPKAIGGLRPFRDREADASPTPARRIPATLRPATVCNHQATPSKQQGRGQLRGARA